MASHIWLGKLKPNQENAKWWFHKKLVDSPYGTDGGQAIIAKGNIIEGIKAKE